MINLLAIDTTTDVCSVALSRSETVAETAESKAEARVAVPAADCVEHTRFAPRMQGEYLLSMVDNVIRGAAMDRSDLDFVAFSAGPASFTGVRIGAAVAQGLAFAVGAQVIAVPQLGGRCRSGAVGDRHDRRSMAVAALSRWLALLGALSILENGSGVFGFRSVDPNHAHPNANANTNPRPHLRPRPHPHRAN